MRLTRDQEGGRGAISAGATQSGVRAPSGEVTSLNPNANQEPTLELGAVASTNLLALWPLQTPHSCSGGQ